MYMWLFYKQCKHHALALIPCLTSYTVAYMYIEFEISYFLIIFSVYSTKYQPGIDSGEVTGASVVWECEPVN